MVSLHEIDVINSRSQGFLALFAGGVIVVFMMLMCTVVGAKDMGGLAEIDLCVYVIGWLIGWLII